MTQAAVYRESRTAAEQQDLSPSERTLYRQRFAEQNKLFEQKHGISLSGALGMYHAKSGSNYALSDEASRDVRAAMLSVLGVDRSGLPGESIAPSNVRILPNPLNPGSGLQQDGTVAFDVIPMPGRSPAPFIRLSYDTAAGIGRVDGKALDPAAAGLVATGMWRRADSDRFADCLAVRDVIKNERDGGDSECIFFGRTISGENVLVYGPSRQAMESLPPPGPDSNFDSAKWEREHYRVYIGTGADMRRADALEYDTGQRSDPRHCITFLLNGEKTQVTVPTGRGTAALNRVDAQGRLTSEWLLPTAGH